MVMTILDSPVFEVTGGVDTHLETHFATALDPIGGLLGVAEFDTTRAGLETLLVWLAEHAVIDRYLSELEREVRWVRDAEEIIEEVANHLLEAVAVHPRQTDTNTPSHRRSKPRPNAQLPAPSCCLDLRGGDSSGGAYFRSIASSRRLAMAAPTRPITSR